MAKLDLILLISFLHGILSVTFDDIAAAGNGNGFEYMRGPPRAHDVYEELLLRGTFPFEELFGMPQHPQGHSGASLFDYDNDGDLDIYVTAGPGIPNSLFQNRLHDDGELKFVDVAQEAGVELIDSDSFGTCFGDLDNDGDLDLYVNANIDPNTLFENQGDGTFRDISDFATEQRGIGRASVGCSIGDVNGDGLHDIFVGNTADLTNLANCLAMAELTEVSANVLLINRGDNIFADESEERGIGLTYGITWAVAVVDYDQDGDVDLIEADDECAAGLPAWMRLYANDGNGYFTEETFTKGIQQIGSYMSFAFADFDGDSSIDIAVTDMGHYDQSIIAALPHGAVPFTISIADVPHNSRWILNDEDGNLRDPGVGDLHSTVFGWGNAAVDIDNDGDTDIVFHGGLHPEPTLVTFCDNPGVVLMNNGKAEFTYDPEATSQTKHLYRLVNGLASGDLNGDGFPDIVTVSSLDVEGDGFVSYQDAFGDAPGTFLPFEGPFADIAGHVPYCKFVNDSHVEYLGIPQINGSLSVEINSGNDNNFISVRTLGSVGLTENGVAPRDGIGAILRVSSYGGRDCVPTTQVVPVTGGDSHCSQHELKRTFGLGLCAFATVEVMWPGGANNLLRCVSAGQNVVMQEIPCDFKSEVWSNVDAFQGCVSNALGDLQDAGVITGDQKSIIFRSQSFAFRRHRGASLFQDAVGDGGDGGDGGEGGSCADPSTPEAPEHSSDSG